MRSTHVLRVELECLARVFNSNNQSDLHHIISLGIEVILIIRYIEVLVSFVFRHRCPSCVNITEILELKIHEVVWTKDYAVTCQ